jgi:GNAT superfamily N-acetyltransferase
VAENLPAERGDGIARFAWDDLPALGVLARATSAGLADDRYIAWQYERNPFAAPERMPLFLHRRDGRVEGQVGARLVRLKIGSSEAAAHWITNLVVEPGAQKRGIGTALHRACVAETGLGLALDVTERAERLFLREGAADLGVVPLYIRVLDSEAFLARRAVPARAAVAPLASRVLAALDRRAAKVLRADSLALVEVDRFSAWADAVWESCAPHYPVLVRRDRAYLNWRFAEDPLHRYRLFEVRRGVDPIGIAVLRVGEWGPVQAGFVVDWLCKPQDAEPLLAACLEVFRESRVAAVYCLHANPVSTGMLPRLGFVRRPSGFRFLVCGEAGADLVRDRGSWFVTLGDSNVDRPRPPSGA